MVSLDFEQPHGQLRHALFGPRKFRTALHLFEFGSGDIITHRVGQNKIAVRKPLHQRAGAQAIGAVIGEVRFADGKQPRNGAHQKIIHPQAAHGVVYGGVNPHGNFVRIFIGDALVHLEQIAIALANYIHAESLYGVREIQIDAQAGLAHAAAFVANCFGVARRYVARHQIAEAGIAALQVIIALALPESAFGGRLSPGFIGTQMRPSLRSDSLINVSFD